MFTITIGPARDARCRRIITMLGAVVVLTLPAVAPGSLMQSGGTITPIAGTGVCGFSGDGGLATNAQLNDPAGLATDSAGNLYIADLGNHVVRKVTPDGVITTVAGTGAPGYNGDNKPATNAQLAAPTAVAVDAAGHYLYIADNANHRIRQVDLLTLIITTVAGTGERGFSGDGGLATHARLSYPSAVALDAVENLYIADTLNYRLRRVDSSGSITPVAGTGQQGFCGAGGPALLACLKNPVALAIGPTGDVFIADDLRVRRVDLNGIITTVAGNGSYGTPSSGGLGTQSSFRQIQGLAVDAAGNLYIADAASHRLLLLNRDGILIVVLVGTGTPGFSGDGGQATQAMLIGPSGLAMDRVRNVLYISDSLNCRVWRAGP